MAREIVSRTKKVCLFCKEKKVPTYTDSVALKRYLSDRGRIVPKLRSGVCSKHQRGVSREIKRARHLALLPFVVKI
ncbi:MAG: 30S ribosomal protein S18 [Candidatus Daviesbacteria bacterium]|nr:MAG: 30S ribosomal protein S18 [Candidatus Daviesbacteria bacterium]